MIDAYMKYCAAIFTRYKNLVKYWITFNEINMLLHMSFMGAGIFFKEGEDRQTILYNAAHHELLASAKAVKLAHEMIPGGKIGCMLATEVNDDDKITFMTSGNVKSGQKVNA